MAEPGELRVLGPVEAIGPGGRAELHGGRQRAVLGILALHANTVLPIPRLVDAVWGDDPPRTAVRTLHSHVARIRQALAACGFAPILVTGGAGYLLDTDPSTVDALWFEEQLSLARKDLATGAVERAAAVLRSLTGLWRGDAFADTPLAGWARHEVDRLHDLRLSAVEDRWDAELRLGNHDEAARALPRLIALHPARERLTGLHMLALYRNGRHTDALEEFQRLRERLADELGVDPGPDLLALHESMLRRDPDLLPHQTGGAPAQLPARVGYFTGRDAELAELSRLLDESGDEQPIVVISGAAGMGKTALAVQWAHRVAERFPDGQLFVDLRGHDPDGALPAAQALTQLLRGLNVPDDRIPAEVEARAALYRSLLHPRRCLVVIDNAGPVADVLDLVPGTGRARLVITSRQRLAALGTRHAVHVVALDALGHDDSIGLLGRVLSAGRVAGEPGPAARLARLCGGMPLALRIAAARLAADPARPIASVTAELAGAGRLENLAVEGDSRTVEAVLASAYRPLEPAQARMFRLLGLSPGRSVSASLGAALCGLPARDGDAAIAGLAAVHLITATGPDRFRFHDLIGEFARQRAATVEPADRQAEAGERLVDWYLLITSAANKIIDPNRDLVTPAARHPWPEVPFAANSHAALAFLGAERENLLPVVSYARKAGHLVAAWQLTYLLTSFYDVTGGWHERVEVCRQGAAAATELGDPLAEAEMLRALGVAYFMIRKLPESLQASESALRAARQAGAGGEGHVYNNIGNALVELRRFDEAVAAYRQAAARAASAGNPLGHALSQRNLGYTYARMSRPADGIEPLTAALAAFRELGNGRLEAATLDTLGMAHLGRGDHDAALSFIANGLAVSRTIGDRWMEWECLLDAGKVHLDRHDFPAAREHFGQALEISRDVAERHGESCALHHLGRAHLGAGNLTAARHQLMRALEVRATVPDDYELAHLHRTLAELEARYGRPVLAADHRAKAIELYRKANAQAEADALASDP